MAALGQLIRETREIHGMEAQVLAQRTGVSKGTISNLERGVLKTTPDPGFLRALSDALGIPVVAMLTRLGYLNEEGESASDSPAIRALRPILESRELTEKQVHQLATMVRGMVEMMEG